MASQPRPQTRDDIAALTQADTTRLPQLVARRWPDCEGNADFLDRLQSLAAAASEPNPFHEPWTLFPALRAHDADRKARILCFEQDGALCAMLPVQRDPAYYGYPLPHWRNWMHDNSFCGAPLVRPGFEGAFWSALLDWADREAGTALFLHLTHLDEHGPLYGVLRQIAAGQDRPAAIVHREERAMLASGLTAEAYLEASLSGKKRKELRRQHRRLSEEGELVFDRQIDASGIAHWIEDFLALERAGWKGANGSALACSEANAAMFRETLVGGANEGRLERLSLTLDGKPIAMLVNFLTPPGAFSYKTAFDEDFARFSPGVLLQRENLDLLANDAIEWCDSCASANHPMIDHFWREKRSMARVSVAIGGKARQAICRQILRRETRHIEEGD